MSVYQELRKLQNIEDAYERWSDYRAVMTDYMISSTDCDSSLAIFGAGACNDIDLCRLISHFSSITLFDSNKAALQQAVARYALSDYNGIHLCVCDLVGITDSDYEDYAATLTEQLQLFKNAIEPQLLNSMAAASLHQLYERIRPYQLTLGKNAFDYSAAFGLHSQLNNMTSWIYHAITDPLSYTDASVDRLIASYNPPIIKKVNDTIISATRKAVLFSNELECTASKGPIAGAMDCILDIKERYPSCEKAVINWPFDVAGNRTYKMLLQKVLL